LFHFFLSNTATQTPLLLRHCASLSASFPKQGKEPPKTLEQTTSERKKKKPRPHTLSLSLLLPNDKRMDIEIWKQQRLLKDLEAVEGNGTTLISLLIPPDTQLARISKLLTQEYGTASCIKSRQTKQAVMDSLKSLQQRMKLVA
jgi:hypothetical protein